jgi:hypothetical protein
MEYALRDYKGHDEWLCRRKQRCGVQLLTCLSCNVLSRHRVVGEGVTQLLTAGTTTLAAVPVKNSLQLSRSG